MAAVSDELNYLSASQALQHFRSGDLSPVELLDAVLAQAEVIAGPVNPLQIAISSRPGKRRKRRKPDTSRATPGASKAFHC